MKYILISIQRLWKNVQSTRCTAFIKILFGSIVYETNWGKSIVNARNIENRFTTCFSRNLFNSKSYWSLHYKWDLVANYLEILNVSANVSGWPWWPVSNFQRVYKLGKKNPVVIIESTSYLRMQEHASK